MRTLPVLERSAAVVLARLEWHEHLGLGELDFPVLVVHRSRVVAGLCLAVLEPLEQRRQAIGLGVESDRADEFASLFEDIVGDPLRALAVVMKLLRVVAG